MSKTDGSFMIMFSKSLMDKLGGFGKNSPFSDKIRLCGWVHKIPFDFESRMGIEKGDFIIFDLPLELEPYLEDLFLSQDEQAIVIPSSNIIQALKINNLNIKDLNFLKQFE